MRAEDLKALLESVAEGRTPVTGALERLAGWPAMEEADHGLTIDTHRALRAGMPEVVFGRNKTVAQVRAALTILHQIHGAALVTATPREMAAELSIAFPEGVYDERSRLFRVGQMPRQEHSAPVAVVCAGASDLPVAEEAAQTLEFAGWPVQRVTDVGVAGLHRLFAKLPLIRNSRIVITVAGMEGALPSVMAGLVAQPVIAVPTSVGYGASFQGVAALLGMLSACASGIGVVNIDNGFGAAMLAIRMLQSSDASQSAALAQTTGPS